MPSVLSTVILSRRPRYEKTVPRVNGFMQIRTTCMPQAECHTCEHSGSVVFVRLQHHRGMHLGAPKSNASFFHIAKFVQAENGLTKT